MLAAGHDYFSLGGFEISPDHRVLAYSTDLNGGERYTLRFRDLDTGADLDDVVENVTYGLAWADDARTCFYVRPDDAMRPNEVWRHRLGTPPADDTLVFREDDERFFVDVGRARSGRFVLIESSSKMTSETWFVPTDAPDLAPRLVAKREHEHEYSVEHHDDEQHGDRFLIVTNDDGARNFKLVAAPVDEPGRENWVDVLPHRDDVRLDAVERVPRPPRAHRTGRRARSPPGDASRRRHGHDASGIRSRLQHVGRAESRVRRARPFATATRRWSRP